jgi:hypothetical protein
VPANTPQPSAIGGVVGTDEQDFFFFVMILPIRGRHPSHVPMLLQPECTIDEPGHHRHLQEQPR